MKISVDHVTNSSSESFGTVIVDTAIAISVAIPYIAATLNGPLDGEGLEDIPEDDWGYEAHESTDPKDPPGTIVQNNRDGSITKTLPDGTIGTQMKDGTIYVTQPDGTTGVVEPDGHQKMTLPDGTKIEHYTDGTSYAEYPDGTSRVEYPDGTVKEQDPKGEVVQMNPDGSFEVTEPNQNWTKVYDKDGKLIKGKTATGSEVTMDDDGNLSGKLVTEDGKEMKVTGNIDDGFTAQDDQGNFIEIGENGLVKEMSYKDENGTYEIRKDGSIDIDFKNPETGDEISLDLDPEKGITYKDSDGNYINIDSEGKGEIHFVDDGAEIHMNKDGSGYYKDEYGEMNTDGKGRVEVKDTEGNYEIVQEHEDGTISYENGNKDGKQVSGFKDKDDNYTFTKNDGSQLIIKDTDLTIKDKDGKTTTYTKEDIENMVKEYNQAGGNHE
jgi:hypothetical protein